MKENSNATVRVIGNVYEASIIEEKIVVSENLIYFNKIKPEKKGNKFLVLVLDVVLPKQQVCAALAEDCLNGIGWCKFDDVKNVFGMDAAKKIIAHCESEIRRKAGIIETKPEPKPKRKTQSRRKAK